MQGLTKHSAKPPRILNNKSLAEAAQILASRDELLAAVLTAFGPPPLWARRPGFPTLVRIVLEQQVSLISARSMYQRLRSNIVPFTPERFIELGEPFLRSLGVTRQKSAYFLHVAHAFVDGQLDLISRLSDEDAQAALLRIKGVGPWTAHIYLLMALRRPDIWPNGDIALAAALGKLRKMDQRPSF